MKDRSNLIILSGVVGAINALLMGYVVAPFVYVLALVALVVFIDLLIQAYQETDKFLTLLIGSYAILLLVWSLTR